MADDRPVDSHISARSRDCWQAMIFCHVGLCTGQLASPRVSDEKKREAKMEEDTVFFFFKLLFIVGKHI